MLFNQSLLCNGNFIELCKCQFKNKLSYFCLFQNWVCTIRCLNILGERRRNALLGISYPIFVISKLGCTTRCWNILGGHRLHALLQSQSIFRIYISTSAHQLQNLIYDILKTIVLFLSPWSYVLSMLSCLMQMVGYRVVVLQQL